MGQTGSRPARSRARVLALGVVIALMASACGADDSDDTSVSESPTTTQVAPEPTEASPATTESLSLRDSLLEMLPEEVHPLTEDIPDNLLQLLVDVRGQGPAELVWVDAGGEVHEGWSEAFLDDWEAITGWTVIESAPGLDLSTAAVQAQVDSGATEWDVFAILDYGTAERLALEGYWEPIDYSLFDVAALPDVAFYSDEEGNLVRGGSGGAIPSQGYYVGASDFGIVLQYNTDVFAEGSQPDSTLDFFDVEQFPGKRCAFNFAQFGGNLEFAAMANGATWGRGLRRTSH
ncbi:MAG: extracellular solute-binding protein [Acidimicrobiia bacterium]|nr:extracellular solute-binding protein [Acidimicrobiia bacterium]